MGHSLEHHPWPDFSLQGSTTTSGQIARARCALCVCGTRGPTDGSASCTRGRSRVPELGTLGSVRGVASNAHPYRDINRHLADQR